MTAAYRFVPAVLSLWNSLSRSELPSTQALERHMTTAANTGLSFTPKFGYQAPAASGMHIQL